MKGYVIYTDITKELLDSLKVGDRVILNSDKKSFKIIGTSKNYFLMTQNNFGKIYYSVCEKILCTRNYNNMQAGKFSVGADNYIWGCPTGYKFDDPKWIEEYLNDFESDKIKLTRRAIALNSISIKQQDTDCLKYSEDKYLDTGIYGLDEEIMNYKEKIVKCRKEHQCVQCGVNIEKGRKALYESGFLDGMPVSAYTCIECVEKWIEEIEGEVE